MAAPLTDPIAHGRTADVYLWDEHHVLKLFRDWCPSDWVDYEARIARAIHAAGRLNKNIAPEREALIEMVKEGYKNAPKGNAL